LKNLLLGSLLLLWLGGCSSSRFNRLQQMPVTDVSRNYILPWFHGDTSRFIFRAHLEFYRHHLGGLMLIKPIQEESYRVLFMTEVGIKIFDMEFFRNGDFKLHYLLEAMKRKSLLETLKNDIGLMLYPVPGDTQIEMRKDRQTGNIVIKSKDKNGVKYFYLEDQYRVNEIIQRDGCIQRMNMTLYSEDSREIDSIRISHSPVKMNIYLSKLNENRSEVSE
jgi:hypothetical protein